MTAISDYVEDEVLDHYLRGETAPTPASNFVGLFSSSVGDDASGTEISAGGYVRRTGSWASSSGGISATDASLNWNPTASWGTATDTGIFDAVSGGNLLFWGPLANAKPIGASDSPHYDSGELTVALN